MGKFPCESVWEYDKGIPCLRPFYGALSAIKNEMELSMAQAEQKLANGGAHIGTGGAI